MSKGTKYISVLAVVTALALHFTTPVDTGLVVYAIVGGAIGLGRVIGDEFG